MPPELRELDSVLLPFLLENVQELVGEQGVTEYVERALRNHLRWGTDRHAFPSDFVLTRGRSVEELLIQWLEVIRELVGPEQTANHIVQAIRRELNAGDGTLGELLDDIELEVGPPSEALIAEAEEFMQKARETWNAG